MSDEPQAEEPLVDQATLDALGPMLARPEVWTKPSPELEDALVAVLTGAEQQPVEVDDELSHRRESRGWARALLGAAAVFIVASLGTMVVVRLGSSGDDGVLVALAGTGPYPGASAEATVRDDDNGISIVMDVTGLPPPAEGSYYAAWVMQPEPRVMIPIGTFRLRDGPGEVELWSGVAIEDYPMVTVTVQTEDAPLEPGEMVLLGRIG